MSRLGRLLAAFLMLAGCATAPAQAGGARCMSRVQMAAFLKQTFGQVSVADGVAANSAVFEFFVNDKTLTWTMIVVNARTSCASIQATGEGWTFRLPTGPEI